jgi:hypothetical protein
LILPLETWRFQAYNPPVKRAARLSIFEGHAVAVHEASRPTILAYETLKI